MEIPVHQFRSLTYTHVAHSWQIVVFLCDLLPARIEEQLAFVDHLASPPMIQLELKTVLHIVVLGVAFATLSSALDLPYTPSSTFDDPQLVVLLNCLIVAKHPLML